MNGLQDFKIEFHEDTAVQGWTQMEHEYIDDCSFVNYMSVNGSEYVIGVYDDRDKAFYQLDRAFSLNMDSTNIDHVSLRVGKLVSKNGEWKGVFMDIDQGYVLVAFKNVGDDIKEIPLESYYSFEGADKAREVLNEIVSDDVTIFISSRRY